MSEKTLNLKLFFPEPIFDLSQISTSTFLYFKNDLATTLHPTVSLYTTGCDPYKFLELLENSQYNYKDKFKTIFNLMESSSKSIHNTTKIIKPLHDEGFVKSIWLAYPRNDNAFKRSEEIIIQSGLTKKELLNMIDPIMASQELVSHILFEKFLEIYEKQLKDYSVSSNKSYEETRAKNIDYKELLNYCDSLFKQNGLEDLLIKSYFFRFCAFENFPDILITNERILPFLDKLKVDKPQVELTHYENLDVISWEIFRQLTSRYLEEKSAEEQINKILDLRINSSEEIDSLKNKCLTLAEQFKGERDIKRLTETLSQHIKINTEKEIRDLLKLDKEVFENVIDSIFSDEKTWIAFGTFMFSLLTGGILLTAGSALATFSNIAAKTYKQVAETENKIKNSDYALIYRLKN